MLHRHLYIVALFAGLAAGCTAGFAETCASNGDCASTLCLGGKCTVPCKALTDCPVGYQCGNVDDAGSRGGCYKPTFDPKTAGGFGADCSLYAPDPRSGVPCKSTVANPCADGYVCHADLKCDPLAYCTHACTADVDCPSTYFCGTLPDGAMTKECIKRTTCSPCAADDQCGAGWACATAADGSHFCAKRCDPSHMTASGFAADCAQPANDDTGFPAASPFQHCTAALPGSSVTVCAPTDGFCHGPSTVAALAPAGAGQTCSPCRLDTPGDCAMGEVCYYDEFTTERFCTAACTVTLTGDGSGNYNVSDDSCQTDAANGGPTYCFAGVPTNCKAKCVAQGACTADPTAAALTCYPAMM